MLGAKMRIQDEVPDIDVETARRATVEYGNEQGSRQGDRHRAAADGVPGVLGVVLTLRKGMNPDLDANPRRMLDRSRLMHRQHQRDHGEQNEQSTKKSHGHPITSLA